MTNVQLSAPETYSPPRTGRELEVLKALRRIMRAVDLHSRRLLARHGLTGPQLVCLLAVRDEGPVRVSTLARTMQVSPSTVIGVLDRLAAKRLVRRRRGRRDRRSVFVSLTEAGELLLARAPSPLQDRLADGLARLAAHELEAIVRSLDRIGRLMEADDLDAAPILETGPLPEPTADATAIEIEEEDD